MSPTPGALASLGVEGVNFRLELSSALLERIANAVVRGRIVVPPIAQVELEEVRELSGRPTADGKTVITL